MTSPSKRIDMEKDSTMFGQLANIEVHPMPDIETSYQSQ